MRAGSSASDPEAWNVDTGERLKVETLRGREIAGRKIDIGAEPTDDTELVLITFDPVKEGASTRLRIEETYTDEGRYGLWNGELLWDRSFGRAHNAIVLPDGWWLTTNAVPATIRTLDDGRQRLDYINARPGNIDVLVKARRR